jgi:hypothetical protein
MVFDIDIILKFLWFSTLTSKYHTVGLQEGKFYLIILKVSVPNHFN